MSAISIASVIFAPVMPDRGTDIGYAANLLRNHGIIVHETDTVPGLAARAGSPEAVEKIFRIKSRDRGKPLLVLVDSREMLEPLTGPLKPEALELLEISREIPVTVVYPQVKGLAPGVTAADGSVAIRIPAVGEVRQLITEAGLPLASTSANLSGDPQPQAVENIDQRVLNLVDYVLILATEKTASGLPSTIISMVGEKPGIIRTGSMNQKLKDWIRAYCNVNDL